MKTPIIRKPKFMRNDGAMGAYLYIAAEASRVAADSSLTPDQQYTMLSKVGECINKAAKAGGFLTTGDFIKWLERQK